MDWRSDSPADVADRADRAGRATSEPQAGPNAAPRKRIAIFIVAYSAVTTLRKVLDRIPKEIWDKVQEVVVFDDSSEDDTALSGLGQTALHGKSKLTIFRSERNFGYGGKQIRGYRYAIEQRYDIVALLHGDGQYAPESLPDLLRPLEAGDADAVIGSRMMSKGAARAGGMPLYKFVGNKVLTGFENAMFGTSLTEFHSGYRLYSCDALKQIPFEKNTTDYHFDTQILIQLHAAGMRIVERPIPTYYGDEIRPVNGMRYAKQVVQSVLDYQLNALGVNHHAEYELPPAYALKKSPLSSHSRILGLLGSSPRRVLDIACGQGGLAHALMQRGHTVTGIDCRPPLFALDEFIEADLAHGLPPMSLERKFEVILLADVLEHMADPLPLLCQAVERLAPGGSIVVSLPNAVHWSTRLLVAFGKFDYTNKGILDRTHLRFFTKASAERLFAAAGLAVSAHHTTPVPWENVLPKIFSEVAQNTIEKADYLFTRLRPNVFAYQHLFELTPVERG